MFSYIGTLFSIRKYSFSTAGTRNLAKILIELLLIAAIPRCQDYSKYWK